MISRSAKEEQHSITTLRTATSPDLSSLLEKRLQLIMTQQHQRRRIFDSWILFFAIAAITFAAVGASSALIIVDFARLDLETFSWRGLSIAASITGGCAVISILLLALFQISHSLGWFHRWVLPAIGASISLAAAVLALAVLILITLNPNDVAATQEEVPDIIVQYVLWAVAALSQLFFYGSICLRRDHTAKDAAMGPPSITMRETKQAPRRPPSPPSPLRMVAPPFALPQASAPLSPAPSLKPKSARSSWRDSLSSFRPATSKTKLVTSRNSLSRDSSVRSIITAQSDAFDSWDTSTVDLHLREAISPAIPSRRRQLEPIPGSRPSSPGTALNGPFPATDEAPSKFYPERPPTARSTTSQSASRGPTKRTFIPTSRPSDVGDESHIHPLFRSDSPTPPPGVSSNTTVIASPIGGQPMATPLLPSRPTSRMRSASQLSNRAPSRAGSRAPSRSESFDSSRRPDGLDDTRPSYPFPKPPSPFPMLTTIATSTQIYPLTAHIQSSDAPSSSDASRSASPDPIGRKMTPPIPDSILSVQREGSAPTSKSSKETLRSRTGSAAPPPGTAL